MMNERETFRRAEEIFIEICDLDHDARQEGLGQACGDDVELARLVRRLLDGDQNPLVEADGAEVRPLLDSVLNDAPAEMPAFELPGYTVIRRIASGGMGTVYEAEQNEPRRAVAIKVLRAGVGGPQVVRRFRNEAQMLGQLSHPGIAKVHDAGTVEINGHPHPFFAMELIRGRSITDHARHRGLSVEQRLDLVAQICDAIAYAHEKGVVHRDLKPPNILVDEHGTPKILDFGVARATNRDVRITTLETTAGQLIGTVPYMSPEQVTGDPASIDGRTDVYSLGVILFELLADRLPLDIVHLSLIDAARIIQEEEPTRLGSIDRSLRGDIETIIGKALEKEPNRRYPSAEALATDIRRFLTNQPILAHPPTTFYQLRKFARRHRTVVAGLAATFLVLVLGIVTTTLFAIQSRANERDARSAAARVQVGAAQSSLALSDPEGARSHLDAVPETHRNWEWRHLAAQLDPVLATVDLDDAGGLERAVFRSDGTPVVLVQRDGRLDLVDLASGATIRSVRHDREVRLPTLAPDLSRVAGLDHETRELLVWSLETGAPPQRRTIDPHAVRSLHFSPSGKRLAARMVDRVLVSDTATGEVTLDRAMPNLKSLVLFPGGDRIACVLAPDDPTTWIAVAVIDLDSGEESRRGVANCISRTLAIAPDGSELAIGLDEYTRQVARIDTTTLESLPSFGGHAFGIGPVAYSGDGTVLASLSTTNELILHEVATGRAIAACAIDAGADADLVLRLAGSGQRLLVVHDALSAAAVDLLDPSYHPDRVLRGHRTFVYQLAFSPDGTLLASVDFDGEIRLWDGRSGEAIAELSSGTRSTVAFSADGRHLIIPGGGAILDLATGRRAVPRGGGSPDSDGAADPRLNAGGAVTETGAISHDGAFIALEQGNSVAILDRATNTVVRTLPSPSSEQITAVAFSLDDSRLVCGREDGTLELWNVRRETLIAEFPGHASRVYAVNFSPDGTRIVSGGNDNTVRLFDVTSHQQVIELHGHTSYVHCVAFSPDGARIASASGDGTVRLWDSVPRRQRATERRADRARRQRLRPIVESLLRNLGDAQAVGDHIGSSADLDPADRAAALRVLLSIELAGGEQ